jgi:uncharacterized protein (DUF2141 family)
MEFDSRKGGFSRRHQGVGLVRSFMLVITLILSLIPEINGAEEPQSQDLGDINVVITELRNAEGEVLISLYNKAEGFPRDRSTIVRSVAVEPDDSGQLTTVFEGLPHGEYAIACLHDEDSSLGMTFGKLHLPKEGYCFSNNLKVRFRAPKFKKAKFTLDADSVTQTIQMRY